MHRTILTPSVKSCPTRERWRIIPRLSMKNNTVSYAFAITREEWIHTVLSFRKFTDFGRGIMYSILTDAYSFDERCAQCWDGNWRESDDFFFDHPEIADKYGFVTCFQGEPIGFICWDPRNRPE